jgi:hypothetical protein
MPDVSIRLLLGHVGQLVQHKLVNVRQKLLLLLNTVRVRKQHQKLRVEQRVLHLPAGLRKRLLLKLRHKSRVRRSVKLPL